MFVSSLSPAGMESLILKLLQVIAIPQLMALEVCLHKQDIRSLGFLEGCLEGLLF